MSGSRVLAGEERTVERMGRQLRSARDCAALTKSELGRSAGLSPTSITNYESGRRALGVEVAISLAAALGRCPAQVWPELGALS